MLKDTKPLTQLLKHVELREKAVVLHAASKPWIRMVIKKPSEAECGTVTRTSACGAGTCARHVCGDSCGGKGALVCVLTAQARKMLAAAHAVRLEMSCGTIEGACERLRVDTGCGREM